MKKNRFFILTIIFTQFFLFEKSFAQEAVKKEIQTPEVKSEGYNLTVDKVDSSRFYNVAVVQGLNKITAKSLVLEMKIGDVIKFGQLTIIARKCWQASLDQKPESKILLEIFEDLAENQDKVGEGKTKNRIFYGWMISSSPSIVGLEHPIYDITALNCKNK